jgi:hypothetical protein
MKDPRDQQVRIEDESTLRSLRSPYESPAAHASGVDAEPTPSVARTVAATALFVLLVGSGVRTVLLRFVVPPFAPAAAAGPVGGLDRKPLRLRRDSTPEELQVFLQRVRLQTRSGDQIAVIFPPPHTGFSYAYWRANYDLAGRRVLPPPDVMYVGSAEYVAAWHDGWSDPRFAPVWSGFGGTLFKHQ